MIEISLEVWNVTVTSNFLKSALKDAFLSVDKPNRTITNDENPCAIRGACYHLLYLMKLNVFNINISHTVSTFESIPLSWGNKQNEDRNMKIISWVVPALLSTAPLMDWSQRSAPSCHNLLQTIVVLWARGRGGARGSQRINHQQDQSGSTLTQSIIVIFKVFSLK